MFKCTYHLASTLLSQVMQSIVDALPYGENHSLIEKLIAMHMMCGLSVIF
jgi:hypothetical protein